MPEPTCDPSVVIVERGDGYVVYQSVTGEKWRINGTCNQCGLCWAGAVGPPPTLDCPVRPEIKDDIPECTLSGYYL